MAASQNLLKLLIPVCPQSLQNAIKLCLGEEVNGTLQDAEGLLLLCQNRLAALNAKEDIRALWTQVVSLAKKQD
jgi:hypothetical protein